MAERLRTAERGATGFETAQPGEMSPKGGERMEMALVGRRGRTILGAVNANMEKGAEALTPDVLKTDIETALKQIEALRQQGEQNPELKARNEKLIGVMLAAIARTRVYGDETISGEEKAPEVSEEGKPAEQLASDTSSDSVRENETAERAKPAGEKQTQAASGDVDDLNPEQRAVDWVEARYLSDTAKENGASDPDAILRGLYLRERRELLDAGLDEDAIKQQLIKTRGLTPEEVEEFGEDILSDEEVAQERAEAEAEAETIKRRLAQTKQKMEQLRKREESQEGLSEAERGVLTQQLGETKELLEALERKNKQLKPYESDEEYYVRRAEELLAASRKVTTPTPEVLNQMVSDKIESWVDSWVEDELGFKIPENDEQRQQYDAARARYYKNLRSNEESYKALRDKLRKQVAQDWRENERDGRQKQLDALDDDLNRLDAVQIALRTEAETAIDDEIDKKIDAEIDGWVRSWMGEMTENDARYQATRDQYIENLQRDEEAYRALRAKLRQRLEADDPGFAQLRKQLLESDARYGDAIRKLRQYTHEGSELEKRREQLLMEMAGLESALASGEGPEMKTAANSEKQESVKASLWEKIKNSKGMAKFFHSDAGKRVVSTALAAMMLFGIGSSTALAAGRGEDPLNDSRVDTNGEEGAALDDSVLGSSTLDTTEDAETPGEGAGAVDLNADQEKMEAQARLMAMTVDGLLAKFAETNPNVQLDREKVAESIREFVETTGFSLERIQADFEIAENMTLYCYNEYFGYGDRSNKVSWNAFGMDKSYVWENPLLAAQEMFRMSAEQPEVLASIVENYPVILRACGLDEGLNGNQIDDLISNGENGGELQRKLLVALKDMLESSNTEYVFSLAQGKVGTPYIKLALGATPSGQELAMQAERTRYNEKQVCVTYTEKADDGTVTVYEAYYNLACGFQANIYTRTPAAKPTAPAGAPEQVVINVVPEEKADDEGEPQLPEEPTATIPGEPEGDPNGEPQSSPDEEGQTTPDDAPGETTPDREEQTTPDEDPIKPDGDPEKPEEQPGEKPSDEPGEDPKKPGDEPGDEPGENQPGDDEPGEDQPGDDEPGEDQPGEDEPGEDPKEPGGEPGGDPEKPEEQPGEEPGGNQPGDEPGGDPEKPEEKNGNVQVGVAEKIEGAEGVKQKPIGSENVGEANDDEGDYGGFGSVDNTKPPEDRVEDLDNLVPTESDETLSPDEQGAAHDEQVDTDLNAERPNENGQAGITQDPDALNDYVQGILQQSREREEERRRQEANLREGMADLAGETFTDPDDIAAQDDLLGEAQGQLDRIGEERAQDNLNTTTPSTSETGTSDTTTVAPETTPDADGGTGSTTGGGLDFNYDTNVDVGEASADPFAS